LNPRDATYGSPGQILIRWYSFSNGTLHSPTVDSIRPVAGDAGKGPRFAISPAQDAKDRARATVCELSLIDNKAESGLIIRGEDVRVVFDSVQRRVNDLPAPDVPVRKPSSSDPADHEGQRSAQLWRRLVTRDCEYRTISLWIKIPCRYSWPRHPLGSAVKGGKIMGPRRPFTAWRPYFRYQRSIESEGKAFGIPSSDTCSCRNLIVRLPPETHNRATQRSRGNSGS